MPQVTIYLDEETEKRMDKAVRESGLSRSRWVGGLIRERTRTEWPESFKRLLGASGEDFPNLEEIREGLGEDVPRTAAPARGPPGGPRAP